MKASNQDFDQRVFGRIRTHSETVEKANLGSFLLGNSNFGVCLI